MAFKENPCSFDSTAYNQTVLVADLTRSLERNIKLLSELEESKAHVLKLSAELQKAQEEIASLKSYNKLKDQCKDLSDEWVPVELSCTIQMTDEDTLNLLIGKSPVEGCKQPDTTSRDDLKSTEHADSDKDLKNKLRNTTINLEVYRIRVNQLESHNRDLTTKLEKVSNKLFDVTHCEKRLRKEIVGTQQENRLLSEMLDKLTVAANAVLDSNLGDLSHSHQTIKDLAQACSRKPMSTSSDCENSPSEMTSYLAQAIADVLPAGCRLITTKAGRTWTIVGNCLNGELKIGLEDKYGNKHAVLYSPSYTQPLTYEFMNSGSSGCGPGPH